MPKLLATFLMICVLSFPLQSGEGPLIENRLNYMLGSFDVVNKNLKPGTRDYHERAFRIEATPIFEGNGIQTKWYEADSGAWFGTVISDFGHFPKHMKTLWYAEAKREWQINHFDLSSHDDAGGITVIKEGKDQFGTFQSKRIHEPTETGFKYVHLRKYPGTEWFIVDQFIATRRPS